MNLYKNLSIIFLILQSSCAFVLYNSKWTKTNLTWYVVQKNCPIDFFLFRRIVYNSIKMWETYGNLKFSELNCKFDCCKLADICVSFQNKNHSNIDNWNFDGKGGTLAHAFYPGPQSINGDVHIDVEENWNVLFLLSVMTHEIGHALGIQHSNVVKSIMTRWYQPLLTKDLFQDDKIAIYTLYKKH